MNAVMKRRMLRRRYAGKEKRQPIPGWLIVVAGFGAAASFAVVMAFGSVFAVYHSYASDYVPIEEKLLQAHVGLTQVYDRGGPESGVLLGSLNNPQSHLLEPVQLEDVSRWVVEATISTEDNTFWQHSGVSARGLVRAAYENYMVHDFGAGSGGSTITQQLVKNVYLCPNIVTDEEIGERCLSAERTLDRKLREIAYAMEVEQDYSKEEILGWYLNQISYADRYVGVQSAAKGYFRKDAADLNLAESALLAGIPAAPGAYHPRKNCILEEGSDTECVVDGIGRTLVGGAAKARQEAVLDLMLVHGRATVEEVAEAKAFDLRVYPVTHQMRAPAFIDHQVEPRLVRMCELGILPLIAGAEDCATSVHSAGYQVTSTLDWAETLRAVELIQQEVAAGLAAGCNCFNASIITIEPSTGQIVVYAPNSDPKNEGDVRVAGNIDQLHEINQPGSSFKPAVYLAWFDLLNRAPMSFIWDTSPLVIGEAEGEDEEVQIVNPRGGSFKSEGLISARAALGGSQNVPAFRAAAEAGVDNVIEVAKRVGITTLHQGFDPTFHAHAAVTYGASIATGGANIRSVDMAYMFSVIANMGVMVGVPHGAEYVDPAEFKSLSLDQGADYDLALEQRRLFTAGHIRLPGTRELDPVVVLEVRDHRGKVIFTQGEPERRQVVDAGSVWLLHTIMSDCQARFIIWSCGGTNRDLALDFHLDGIRVPGGVKTGTQQGPLAAADTLETWMIGYTRHAVSAVWVGNANNELVRDGPAAGYAAAHTTLWLFKGWMAEYHRYLRDVRGAFTTPAGFEEMKPANVTWGRFKSPITERGHGGGCSQYVNGWQRNDVTYEDPCQGSYVRLPDFKPDAAQKLARMGVKYIPIPGGAAPPDANVGTTDHGASTGGPAANQGNGNGNGGNDRGNRGNDRGNRGGGQGNADGSSNAGGGDSQAIVAPAPQPIGLQECIEGCPERPLRLICGPGGWFIDRHSDYANTLGWREGLVMAEDTDLDAAVRRICG